jgi:cellulose synthase/poly-beta-1,6-N-acetylglucosamine synthase-like glycosyltransferase
MALLLCLIRDYKFTYTVLTFVLCGMYGTVIFARLFSVMLGLLKSSEHRITPAESHSIPDADLPVYTVLVPMYKEPEVAQKIARTVTSLDYPLDKLDVKLLLEEDDGPTRMKIEEVIDTLPHCVEVIIAPKVPKTEPRTKPRACNWGLERAKGDLLVVFDAEDQPEPDQLRKAAYAFSQLEAKGKKNVICLQAKLNYFNARQNHLTRFFTLEYTNWFDLFLPGLHAIRTPIPLGGTSNHFRTAPLKELGGWDPFNVTEDCDLGIRMARKGFSTEVLDSTTWEEANSQLPNWIRQRSRWIKGYFQTHLVHTREAILPMAGIALLYAILCKIFVADLAQGVQANIAPIVKAILFLCAGCAAAAGACALYTLGRRVGELSKGAKEGHLNPWKALTFRFTVGGLSVMLLLNLLFWVLTILYIFRVPISNHMPAFVAEARPFGTRNYELLHDWQLYYENVTDERFAGSTLWNTLSDLVIRKDATWKDSVERISAIDTWSLTSQLIFPVAVMLFVANGVFVLLGLVSCQKRSLWDLFPYALLVPIYWIFISIAACKGFYQLFTNPWYWEKTVHGLDTSAHPPPPPLQTAESAAGE